MAISTNSKPTIQRNLYDDMDPNNNFSALSALVKFLNGIFQHYIYRADKRTKFGTQLL